MSALIEILAEFLLTLLLWPVVLVLATPVIFVAALFRSGAFWNNVEDGYRYINEKYSKHL